MSLPSARQPPSHKSVSCAAAAGIGAGDLPPPPVPEMLSDDTTSDDGSDDGAGPADGAGDDNDDAASVMTADEDAFDVVEAFDEGVDYSILDNPDDGAAAGGVGARGAAVCDMVLPGTSTVRAALCGVSGLACFVQEGDAGGAAVMS